MTLRVTTSAFLVISAAASSVGWSASYRSGTTGMAEPQFAATITARQSRAYTTITPSVSPARRRHLKADEATSANPALDVSQRTMKQPYDRAARLSSEVSFAALAVAIMAGAATFIPTVSDNAGLVGSGAMMVAGVAGYLTHRKYPA